MRTKVPEARHGALLGPFTTAIGFARGREGIWPIVAVAYACLLPRELSISLAGAALFPYRLLLLLFVPYIVTDLVKRPIRFSFVDACAIFVSAWPIVSLLVHHSPSTAFVTGGAYALDYMAAYLLGRLCIRTTDQFRAFIILMIPAFLLTSVSLMVESVSHRMIVRPLFAELTGKPRPFLYERARIGLLRATGPFPHPILGGVFMASLLPLGWYAFRSQVWRLLGIGASLGAIFTVSSTALIGLLLGVLLIAIAELQRFTRLGIVQIIGLYLILAYLVVSAVSESGPVSVFIRYFTLDPGTGYYRRLIWEYAGAEAVNNPVFGIGLNDWHRLPWMVESVDSFWLFQAMRFGFAESVGFFLLLSGTIISLLVRRAPISEGDRDQAIGISVSLGTLMIAGLSVHLWEGVLVWVTLLAGAGVTLGHTSSLRSARRKPRTAQNGYGRAIPAKLASK